MQTPAAGHDVTHDRILAIHALMTKAMETRGHVAVPGRSRALVHGERVGWSIYEPSVRRKVPLTNKDQYPSSTDRERGWKYVLEPGGSLTLIIDAEFHGATRMADTRELRLEDRIEVIVDRFETMAAETIERRKRHLEDQCRAAERQKRRAERERLQLIENRKWSEFGELAGEWAEAARLRQFVTVVAKFQEEEPDPSGKVGEWLAWARANVDALDPLARGMEGFLERLFPPGLSDYEKEFGEAEDIDG